MEIRQRSVFANNRCTFQDAAMTGSRFYECCFCDCDGLPPKAMAAFCFFENQPIDAEPLRFHNYSETPGD